MQSVVQLAAGFYQRMERVTASDSLMETSSFPVALDLGDYVSKAIAIASSVELKGGIQRRIKATQHVLFEDDGVKAEWTQLFLNIAQ
jgi:hypothetical protein